MIPYAEFRRAHRGMYRGEFLALVTEPHLLVPTDLDSLRASRRTSVTTRLPIMEFLREPPPAPRRTAPPDLSLIPVRKRAQSNPFSDMITIGRARNNDVVVEHICVSGFHAYMRRQGTWLVNDAGSSNGTLVDWRPLPPERPITSGSLIELGGAVLLEFLEPEELYNRVKSATSTTRL